MELEKSVIGVAICVCVCVFLLHNDCISQTRLELRQNSLCIPIDIDAELNLWEYVSFHCPTLALHSQQHASLFMCTPPPGSKLSWDCCSLFCFIYKMFCFPFKVRVNLMREVIML